MHGADQALVGVHIDLEYLLPQVGRELVQRRHAAEDAGIAHHDVDTAETLIQRRGQAVDQLGLFQIQRHQRGAAALCLDLVVQFLQRAGGAGHADHMGTLGGIAFGDGGTDAAAGAGDQRDAVLQAHGYSRVVGPAHRLASRGLNSPNGAPGEAPGPPQGWMICRRAVLPAMRSSAVLTSASGRRWLIRRSTGSRPRRNRSMYFGMSRCGLQLPI